MKRNYLIAAIISFACGAAGGVLGVVGDGSVTASIAQVFGYCGAGYFASQYQSE